MATIGTATVDTTALGTGLPAGAARGTDSAKGIDFREARRRTQGLPPEVLRELTRLSAFKGALGVSKTVFLAVAAIAASVVWWNPWVIIPALIVIAGQQQACLILVHDAAHYRLFPQRWLNDQVGCALGVAVGISMRSYRVIHRLHHNHLYEERDPDIPIFAGYPRGRRYLLRKLLLDISGIKKNFAYFFGAPAINDNPGIGRPLDDTAPALRLAARRDRWLVLGFHIIAPIAAFTTGWGIEYMLLWILPLVTIQQPVFRYRTICEHGAVTDTASPLQATRTYFPPHWLRWFMSPHNVHYHIEHHLYPSVPFYNLRRCHEELMQRGLLKEAAVGPMASFQRLFLADPATARKSTGKTQKSRPMKA